MTAHRRNIYLDYHASTPCEPSVVRAMQPFFATDAANASSSHQCGLMARRAVENARACIARVVGASAHQIALTSGTTESNALAILGCALYESGRKRPRHRVIVSAIEHKAVLNQRKVLARLGFDVTVVPVTADGIVDLDKLEAELSEQTLLVSIQAVNNVLGTVQPLSMVADLAHRVGAKVHTDAAQALGKLVFDVDHWNVDLASFSAHKVYGPKGVGSLYVREGVDNAPLLSPLAGGGQEGNVRSGTINVAGAVGFGAACEILERRLSPDIERFRELRDLLELQLLDNAASRVTILCRNAPRVPTCVAVRFHGVEADAVAARLPEFAFSTGSACESGAPEPSHVFVALGMTRTQAGECIRLSIGRQTTQIELVTAATALVEESNEILAVVGSGVC